MPGRPSSSPRVAGAGNPGHRHFLVIKQPGERAVDPLECRCGGEPAVGMGDPPEGPGTQRYRGRCPDRPIRGCAVAGRRLGRGWVGDGLPRRNPSGDLTRSAFRDGAGGPDRADGRGRGRPARAAVHGGMLRGPVLPHGRTCGTAATGTPRRGTDGGGAAGLGARRLRPGRDRRLDGPRQPAAGGGRGGREVPPPGGHRHASRAGVAARCGDGRRGRARGLPRRALPGAARLLGRRHHHGGAAAVAGRNPDEGPPADPGHHCRRAARPGTGVAAAGLGGSPSPSSPACCS